MTHISSKLEREVKALLIATGLPWQICRCRRHMRAYLAGELVGTFATTIKTGKDTKKIAASIRRVVEANSNG